MPERPAGFAKYCRGCGLLGSSVSEADSLVFFSVTDRGVEWVRKLYGCNGQPVVSAGCGQYAEIHAHQHTCDACALSCHSRFSQRKKHPEHVVKGGRHPAACHAGGRSVGILRHPV